MPSAIDASAGTAPPGRLPADDPRISVVMPVYNGERVLRASLAPLGAMRRSGEIAEIIVVDDGSTDASAAIAAEHGARVLRSGGRVGPGGARNVAAPQALGDVLWFVDADVVVHDDAARALAAAFATTGAAAVFGSYDDRPTGSNFLSQYKNLVHHFYHHGDGGDADTFWAGCGAIRKEAFLASGGFDAERYPYPSVEDIELGYRLRQRGLRIVLDPRIQGTHLKIWRLGNLLHTDIARRALPWARLILSKSGLPDALNVGVGERINAALAAGLLASAALAAARLAPFWLPLGFVVAVAVANARLFGLFRRARGAAFAVGAVAFHQIYYLYSSAVYVACWLERRFRKGQR
ncbi:MAG TPA: glycosyltransferase [Casimicrobiaceae bacterium]|nr:glycosyltransferase [Casimicrobiaceae bacterium]